MEGSRLDILIDILLVMHEAKIEFRLHGDLRVHREILIFNPNRTTNRERLIRR